MAPPNGVCDVGADESGEAFQASIASVFPSPKVVGKKMSAVSPEAMAAAAAVAAETESSTASPGDRPPPPTDSPETDADQEDINAFEEMTLDEIFNGKGVYFPGLIPLVYAYLDFINCDPETFARVDQYLQFIAGWVLSCFVQPPCTNLRGRCSTWSMQARLIQIC